MGLQRGGSLLCRPPPLPGSGSVQSIILDFKALYIKATMSKSSVSRAGGSTTAPAFQEGWNSQLSAGKHPTSSVTSGDSTTETIKTANESHLSKYTEKRGRK